VKQPNKSKRIVLPKAKAITTPELATKTTSLIARIIQLEVRIAQLENLFAKNIVGIPSVRCIHCGQYACDQRHFGPIAS
jgi:hypothetical protein